MMRTEPDAACVEWMSGERTPGQVRSTTGHPVTPDGVNCRPTPTDAVGVRQDQGLFAHAGGTEADCSLSGTADLTLAARELEWLTGFSAELLPSAGLDADAAGRVRR